MVTNTARSTAMAHHVPLDFNVNFDSSCSILNTHEDNLEALSTHNDKRQPVMQKIFAWMSSLRSSPRHPDWPLGLERHCRHIKSKAFKKCVDSIMRLLVICPPGPDGLIEANRVSNLGSSKTTDGATFDSFVEEDLTFAMQPGVARYLQLWLLAPDAKSQSCFSFLHQLVETLRNRLHEMHKAPSQALALSVADIWNADIVSRNMLSSLTSPYPRYPSLKLPSMKQSGDETAFFSHVGMSFTLEWQSRVLKYENDLKIYVWQPHLQKRPDIYNVVNVVIMPAMDGESQQRMAMSLRPPKLLSVFFEFQKTRMSTQMLPNRHPWSAKHELFLTLLAVLDWVAIDITRFVENMAYELREMTIKGRRLPSRSKVQYLLHLDDCRRRGVEDLSHSLRLLDQVLQAVESKTFCCQETKDRANAVKRVITTRDDLRFLRGRLNSLAQPITTVREQVVEQMALSQSQRGLILTIVAALFIPLSFVSGIFGMNIDKDFFPPPRPRQSHPTSSVARAIANMTTMGSTPVITSRSNLLKRDDDDNAQHFFTMAQYLKVALPMTGAVIILPLIAGPLVRFSVQKAFDYHEFWRLLSILGALLYFGLVYGFLYWYHDGCPDAISCPNFWWYSRDYVTFVVYLVLVAGSLGIISAIQLFRAHKRKRERRRWVVFALLVVICVISELFADYPGLPSWGLHIIAKDWVQLRPIPLTWIPFVFLVISWSIPRFKQQNPFSKDFWKRRRNTDLRPT